MILLTFLPRKHRSERGIALIIVLGLLVLLVALTVGFLMRVATERASTASYAHTAAASRLAHTSVQLVQGQIEHAATRADTIWVSQPGMVRTYTGSGGTSQLDTAYKLYSARVMTSSDVDTLLTDDLPPTGWANAPAEWTDLNAPVISEGRRFFPILNPSAKGIVPGFSITDPSREVADAIPMPVRWLYVLAGGQIIAPTSSAGNGVSFIGSHPAPTEDNPIVGRIAFWTDDESCKVNVNTAGAPTFFDLPWYNSTQEQNLADTQPVRGEFQRYPGHPATVDLTSVLSPVLEANGISMTQRQVQKAVLDLVPRLQEGGSLYGTVNTHKPVGGSPVPPVTLDTDRLYPSSDEMLYPASTTVPKPVSTLLTSADLDMLRFFLTAHSRAPELNPFGLPKMAIWPLHVINDAAHRTPYEMLINRASSINDHPYFFQRADSRDPESDWKNIARNQELFSYLDILLSKPLPGIGLSLGSKFGIDKRQILAEIFDYIRCTNLYDDLIPVENRFTRKRSGGSSNPEVGHGFVAPLRITPDGAEGEEYMGFGRFYTISELSFLFICNADGYDINTDGEDSDPAFRNPNNPADVDWDVEAEPSPSTDYPYPWNGTSNPSLNKPEKRLIYENYERKRSRYGPGYTGPRDPVDAPDNRAVPVGQKLGLEQRRVQMIILPELFSPMYGYGILRPDMSITITGLQSIQINGVSVFSSNSETVEITAGYKDLSQFWPLGGPGGFRIGLIGDTPYPFVGIPVTVTVPTSARADAKMPVSIGPLKIEIFYGTTETGGRKLVQTLSIDGKSASIPVPNLVAFQTYPSSTGPEAKAETWWGLNADGVVAGVPGRLFYAKKNGYNENNQGVGIMMRGYGSTTTPTGPTGRYVKDTDVVRSFVPRHGDYRLVAGRSKVSENVFVPLRDWDSSEFLIHALHEANWASRQLPGAIDNFDKYRKAITAYGKPNTMEAMSRTPDFPLGSTSTPDLSGDYDKGLVYAIDGPYINKPDEGNIQGTVPYFSQTDPSSQTFDGVRFFSPNRVMPSPGMFGSLPTHVMRDEPWRTLLFRPQPNHPNWGNPKDHNLMEFFWMPVVEPYAISEPFSTAGKINMNYQMMPFTWLERSTGLRAALSEERITAAPTTASEYYNLAVSDQTEAQHNFNYRRKINAEETLRQFTEDYFDEGKVFLSASEICDLYLVPEGESLDEMDAFWSNYALTSDNVRERIYTTLYPKLTVRSNIFTIHYKVQALKKHPNLDPTVWTENVDSVIAEYRGSTTIERFIDPNDTAIPDYPSEEDPTNEPSAATFYRWRTIRSLPFSP